MLTLIFRFVSRLLEFMLRFSLGLRLLARLRRRDGLKWGIPAMLIAVPYWAVAVGLAQFIQSGGSGWINLVVLWCATLSIAFVVNGPISLTLLGKARITEAYARRHRFIQAAH